MKYSLKKKAAHRAHALVDGHLVRFLHHAVPVAAADVDEHVRVVEAPQRPRRFCTRHQRL